ncbi:uncharacterized protein SETTUDRAFT_21583 [Exserohilum turcica Et28A]|uniref:Uncharacterized protein n=1 Tax=Exserohilum turcicum (strain 28A) TaxID=671987 RepID=R0IGV4_EXST2|nr:uncharacterized protein SETTUDRAFT_21583 [Exserohilum turcica Et28A]EOA84226.1 hypothetical protein SETTUDRAFT_21583 [Exserohilum turcica Et28A]
MLTTCTTGNTPDVVNTRSAHDGSSPAIAMPPQDRSREDPPSPPPQPPPSPAHWSRIVSIESLAPLDI